MYRKSVLSAAILALLFCSVKAETGGNICSGGDIAKGNCVRFLDCDDDLVNTEYIDQQQANNLDARKAACSSSTVKMVSIRGVGRCTGYIAELHL
uniref:Putative secreted protein n=1 Tax=Anopheles marajoara TaxID=58244 RepID=A0A2M4C9B7_9DIPT